MSTTVEKLEHNMAKLTVEVPAEDFEAALAKAYNKNKKSIQIPGFRKGKAPRAVIEKMYGAGVFYEDAAEYAVNTSYDEAAKESGLDITSRPAFEVVQVEKGKPFIYTAEVAVKPDVKLGKYKGLEVPKQEIKVTAKDVNEALKKEQEKNARSLDITEEAAIEGDTVSLDFEGFVDGEAFEGGKGTDYPLTLGSNQFIPGFEEQLVGKKIEEPCEVNVTFPEEYGEKSLAGKSAVFKCTIHKITRKELPELNDDFAKDVSEFDNLKDYKADLKKSIKEDREKAAKQVKENAAIQALVEASEMDVPDAMIETNVDELEQNYANNMASQGIPYEQYLKFMNMTREGFREQLKSQALNNIKSRLVLEAVVEAEGIKVTDERYEEEVKKMAGQYGMEEEKLKGIIDEHMEEQMRKDLAVQEAITFLGDNAKEVEKAAEEDTAKAGKAAEDAGKGEE